MITLSRNLDIAAQYVYWFFLIIICFINTRGGFRGGSTSVVRAPVISERALIFKLLTGKSCYSTSKHRNRAMSAPLLMGMLCHDFCYSSSVYIIADKVLSMPKLSKYDITSWQSSSGYSIYPSWLNCSYATTFNIS